MSIIIREGWAHRQNYSQHNIFDSEKNSLSFACSVLLTGLELGSWNVKSDAQPIELPSHPSTQNVALFDLRIKLVVSWKIEKFGAGESGQKSG